MARFLDGEYSSRQSSGLPNVATLIRGLVCLFLTKRKCLSHCSESVLSASVMVEVRSALLVLYATTVSGLPDCTLVS